MRELVKGLNTYQGTVCIFSFCMAHKGMIAAIEVYFQLNLYWHLFEKCCSDCLQESSSLATLRMHQSHQVETSNKRKTYNCPPTLCYSLENMSVHSQKQSQGLSCSGSTSLAIAQR
ncbi:hypothetical protein XELAEV_18028074mg [Xenopus laevis]|uniref:Uncharacterized protein n=1 Tax=Xenopus laevis TaxID=8355 RepID=A0A974HK76_XENLA|nr:hypothetical protein XELAEV_18028074mg [Xenopus laevis]